MPTRTRTAKSSDPVDASEIVRRAFDAWNRDDFDAATTVVDPEVEWHASGVFPGVDPVYRGSEQVRAWWEALKEPFEQFNVEPVRFTLSDDRIAILTRFRARGKESGAEVDLQFVEVWRARDGLITHREGHRATPETIARYGLAG